MSGECDKCGEHTLECKCLTHWSKTEEGKKLLLKEINDSFFFLKDGTVLRRDGFCEKCDMNTKE